MFDKMKQLMELKKQADQLKRELDVIKIDINDVHGIKLSVNGSQNFTSLEISDGYMTPESKKRLENDLLRSINAAVKKSQSAAASKMKEVMPGMGGFPGL